MSRHVVKISIFSCHLRLQVNALDVFVYLQLFLRFHQFCALIWVVSLVLHSVNTWKWIVGPVALVLAERMYFLIMTCVNRTQIETGSVHGQVGTASS